MGSCQSSYLLLRIFPELFRRGSLLVGGDVQWTRDQLAFSVKGRRVNAFGPAGCVPIAPQLQAEFVHSLVDPWSRVPSQTRNVTKKLILLCKPLSTGDGLSPQYTLAT